MDIAIINANHDLSVAQQLATLDLEIGKTAFETEWACWKRAFDFLSLPGSLSACLNNAGATFSVIDRWRGTRHVELMNQLRRLITDPRLGAFQLTKSQSTQGAMSGGDFARHSLIAVLGMADDKFTPTLAPVLALAFMGASAPKKAADSNILLIARAAHNRTAIKYATFLSRCPGEWPHDYPSALKMSAGFREHLSGGQPLESAEESFLSALRRIANALLADLQNENQSPSPAIAKQVKDPLPVPETDPIRMETFADVDENDDDADDTGNNKAGRSRPLAPIVVREFIPLDIAGETGEPPDIDVTIVVPEVPADEPPLDKATETAVGIREAFRSALQNQHLQYQWAALTPIEIGKWIQRIDAELHSTTTENQKLAWVAGLAMCLGMRPDAVLSVLFSSDEKPGIDLARGIYIKAVPRPPHSWKPKAGMIGPLEKTEDTLKLVLPTFLVAVGKKLFSGSRANQSILAALGWNPQQADLLLKTWITNARNKIFRFHPKRIARILETQVYNKTQRATIVYWLAGTSNDPPPSSVYYTGIPAAALVETYQNCLRDIWSFGNSPIDFAPRPILAGWVGSRLNPPLSTVSALAPSLRTAIVSDDKDDQSIRRWHNQYAIYTVHLLMYATGHRPVNDPFDTAGAVDEHLGYTLINDKFLGRDHAVRLVPLPDIAREQWVRYRAHLAGLLSQLSDEARNFKACLRQQLANSAEPFMPFFFLLNEDLNWISLTSSALRTSYPSSWDFPTNLHRHLLATHFLEEAISEEASAQFLGHVDIGTSSLSLQSPFAPDHLFAAARQSANRFLMKLGFAVVSGVPENDSRTQLNKTIQPPPVAAVFGAAQRRRERERQELNDLAIVQKIVDDAIQTVGGTDNLTDATIYQMVEALDKLKTTSVDRRGLLRHEHLRNLLLQLKSEQGLRIPIPKPHQLVKNDPSLYAENCLVLAGEARKLKEAFWDELDQLRTPLLSNQSNRRAAYALFALIANAWILDRAVLDKLLTENRFSVILDDGNATHYVELPCGLKNLRRYPLDASTTTLLHNTQFVPDQKKNILNALHKLVTELYKRIGLVRGKRYANAESTLRGLITLFTEQSKLLLPGVLVAYHCGDAGAVSLPRHAWLRHITGQVPRASDNSSSDLIINDSADRNDCADFSTQDDSHNLFESPLDESWPRSRKLGMDFIGEMDQIFKRIWKLRDANDNTVKVGHPSFIQVADELEKAIKKAQHAKTLIPIAFYLARWVIRLCRYGSVKGRVEASTIRKYIGALKHPFVEYGHSLPAYALHGDGLLELYSQTLDNAQVDNAANVFTILTLFHRFLEQDFGFAKMDWAEVIPENFQYGDAHIDAGFVTDQEYLIALQLLADDPLVSQRFQVMTSFALLLLRRFGIRPGEALGLQQKDIWRDPDRVTIRVARNQFRGLKTNAAVRVVPLIGDLNPLEESVFSTFLAHVEHCHSDDRLAGIFSDENKSRSLISSWKIAGRISETLKAATHDTTAHTYHCRHSLASALSYQLLIESTDGSLDAPTTAESAATPASSAGPVLMGQSHRSRRGVWGLATILGHGHPRTTQKHYMHFHDELSREFQRTLEAPAITAWQTSNTLGVYPEKIFDRGSPFTAISGEQHIRRLTRWPAVSKLVEPRGLAALAKPRHSDAKPASVS